MKPVTISAERLPLTPDFRTEHRTLVDLYSDAVDPAESGEAFWGEHYALLRRGSLLVARVEHAVAGIALADAPIVSTGQPGIARLQALATSREYRGQHVVGPALLNATVTRSKQQGARILELQASDERLSFYERHGFHVVNETMFGFLLHREL